MKPGSKTRELKVEKRGASMSRDGGIPTKLKPGLYPLLLFPAIQSTRYDSICNPIRFGFGTRAYEVKRCHAFNYLHAFLVNVAVPFIPTVSIENSKPC